MALMRLQQTYDLPPATISDGIAPDVPSSTRMSADDTFAIGKEAYMKEDYVECELWMRETLRLLGIGRTQGKAPSRFEVLDYLAFAEQEASVIVSQYSTTVSQYHSITVFTVGEIEPSVQLKKGVALPNQWFLRWTDGLCKDGLYSISMYLPVPKRHKRKLVCWCDSWHPRLKLKPAKVERVYVNPDVLLFRAVLSDNEVQRIKELALPMLNRATVHNPSTGRIEFANYRISKSAWLEDSLDPLIKKIDTKIEAMTNLTMETAESLQIANYGIGGHYDTHFDFSRLSDVSMGGGTVFTNLHIEIRPSKGDAVFWYNLHEDGMGNYNTRHAACPVLLGEKWVANKWIHERGQEFTRRCPLDRYASEKE
eukprot:gene13260-4092_t